MFRLWTNPIAGCLRVLRAWHEGVIDVDKREAIVDGAVGVQLQESGRVGIDLFVALGDDHET